MNYDYSKTAWPSKQKKQQQWMAAFSKLLPSWHRGRVDWPTATHFFNQGMTPEKAAEEYLDSSAFKTAYDYDQKSAGLQQRMIERALQEIEAKIQRFDNLMTTYEFDKNPVANAGLDELWRGLHAARLKLKSL